MHATAHRGGRKLWIYTITLHPALGIQNLKLTTKRQFSLMQFKLYANIRRKTSAFLKIFAIILQITYSDAIETNQLWRQYSLSLSTLSKIGIRQGTGDDSKFLRIWSTSLYSQQRASSSCAFECDKVRCNFWFPPDATAQCHESLCRKISTHRSFRRELATRYC